MPARQPDGKLLLSSSTAPEACIIRRHAHKRRTSPIIDCANGYREGILRRTGTFMKRVGEPSSPRESRSDGRPYGIA